VKEMTHSRFWLLDMFLSEEELTVQIAQVDGIKIDYVDVSKAGHDQVLEQFASYPTGTNK
jgi:hypothetical protein